MFTHGVLGFTSFHPTYSFVGVLGFTSFHPTYSFVGWVECNGTQQGRVLGDAIAFQVSYRLL
ncbi:hypothetical protein B9T07_22995 [Limnospira fusiformis CCALA 023]